MEEFETIDIENLPQNTIVQWPKKPLPKNQAIVTKPCSVVLHKLKLIRIPDDGSSPGKIMERRLPRANETNKVGITCGKLTYRAEYSRVGQKILKSSGEKTREIEYLNEINFTKIFFAQIQFFAISKMSKRSFFVL